MNPVFEAFLDGFTGGGLFTPLRQPGAASQVFADPIEEIELDGLRPDGSMSTPLQSE